MNGYICFYKGTSLISRMIKWFTWGEYSHVAYMFENGELIEAWHEGGKRWWHGAVVHRASWLKGHKAGTVIERYKITGMDEEHEQIMVAFLKTQVGKKYDTWGIIGFLGRKVVENPLAWFCSELVMEAIKRAGTHLLLRVPSYKVSPSMMNTSPLLELYDVVRTI